MCFKNFKSKKDNKRITKFYTYRKSYTIMESKTAFDIADIISKNKSIEFNKLDISYNPFGNYYTLLILTDSKDSLDKIAQEVNNYYAKRN